MSRTHDELIKWGGSGIAPSNNFPSAASGPMETVAADAPTRESVFPFPNAGAAEYKQPGSNLPMTVSAATVLAQNEGRGDNQWPGDPGSAPLLSGTKVVKE
jgi:hypothetical protein